MDAAVFPEGRGYWHVNAKPTMRSLGEVTSGPDGAFTVTPDDGGSDLEGIRSGPYASLDEALLAIGDHLGGACRLARSRSFR